MSALEVSVAAGPSGPVLVLAAAKITAQHGTVTLLNPQPPVARLLELLCVDDMISSRAMLEKAPAIAAGHELLPSS